MSIVPKVVPRPFGNHFTQSSRTRAFSLVELLVTIALIIIIFVMLYGKSSRRFQHEQKQACQANLQSIYVALQLYANDGTNGLYPVRKDARTSEPALALLVPRCTTVTAPFVCPGTKRDPLPEGESFEKRQISYAYYMGHTAGDSATPLMSDAQVNDQTKIRGQQLFSPDGNKPGNNHHKYGGNIMFCDGNVEMSSTKAAVSLVLTQGVVLLNPRP